MILSFRNEGTEDIFNGENTKAARNTCPQSLWRTAARKLDQLDSVTELNELRIPPATDWSCYPRIAQDNIAFVSTTNIESASRGVMLVPSKLKSLITTE